MVQSEGIQSKFILETGKAFPLQHIARPPLSAHVVLPTIVTRYLLLSPALWIVTISQRQMEGKSHPASGVIHFSHFPTMECLYVIRSGRLLVIW